MITATLSMAALAAVLPSSVQSFVVPRTGFVPSQHVGRRHFGVSTTEVRMSDSGKPVFELPVPEDWNDERKQDKANLLADLESMLERPDGSMSKVGALMQDALSQVCNPLLTPDTSRGKYWLKYRNGKKGITEFFDQWLTTTPIPLNPGYHIEQWDHLANTNSGLELIADRRFKKWMVRFLDLRGRWINSRSSTYTLPLWMRYEGTPEHPFNIDEYIVPEGGYESFNQFFLRQVDTGKRLVSEEAKSDPNIVVSPCDGGVFFLTQGELGGNSYTLKDKTNDIFNLQDAIQGYGSSFVGGPLLDILLWFTDYHHFSAPVSGEVIHIGEYEGSYNYDFDNFDADDPYAPSIPADSDRVGWYQDLPKHKRTVWVFKTEKMGLVAMIAVGFWGVGSIIHYIKEGDVLEKGDFMGNFGYGGSSIVLAFEPAKHMQFAVGKDPISDPDHPVLVEAKMNLGKRTKDLSW